MKKVNKDTFEEETHNLFSIISHHIREKGERYRNVLQKADEEMYKNKEYLKAKYNIQGRK